MRMREKLIAILEEVEGQYNNDFPTIEQIADGLLENGVTIPVRCKECKHRGDYGCPMYHEEYIEWDDDEYHESEIICYDRTRDDGFCDLGERRTDG